MLLLDPGCVMYIRTDEQSLALSNYSEVTVLYITEFRGVGLMRSLIK